MEQYTEVDFYKSMLNLQVWATEIAANNVPQEIEGKIAYPVDDGGMEQVLSDIKSLQRALAILKQDNP